MAQWLGQFTGNSHATRVREAQEALRVGIEAVRKATLDEDRARKAKAMRRLAETVLEKRHRFLKARITAIRADERVDAGSRPHIEKDERPRTRAKSDRAAAEKAKTLETLVRQQREVEASSVADVLREFDAVELLVLLTS